MCYSINIGFLTLSILKEKISETSHHIPIFNRNVCYLVLEICIYAIIYLRSLELRPLFHTNTPSLRMPMSVETVTQYRRPANMKIHHYHADNLKP